MPKGIYQRDGIWWARFKIKGIEYRQSLRTRSIAVAERRMKAARQATEDMVFFGATDPVTWQAAVVSWNATAAKTVKPATFTRYLVSLGQCREWLDGVPVQKIDNRQLKTLVSARQKHGATNATIRRDLTAISSVLAHCVDEGWIEENPARMIDRSRFKEGKGRIMLPRDGSIDAVLAIKGRFIDMAAFSLETGMRQEEVAGLEHDRIDRRRMSATLEETKSGRVREVPLSAYAMEIIDRQPQYLRTRFVFWRGAGDRFQNVGSQFYATVTRVARKAAQQGTEFRPFRFHDLRHLFAVRYLREGRGGIYQLQQVLGHASIKTTERYLDHLTPDEKQAAIQGVAQNTAPDQRSKDAKGLGNGG